MADPPVEQHVSSGTEALQPRSSKRRGARRIPAFRCTSWVWQDRVLRPDLQKGLHQTDIELLQRVPAEARIGRMHEIFDRTLEPTKGQRLPD